MGSIEWPRLPIHSEDLPNIRELLTAEEYEKLMKRPLDPPHGKGVMFKAVTLFRVGELMQQFRANILFNNARQLGVLAASRPRPHRLNVRVLQQGESAEVPGSSEWNESIPENLRKVYREILSKLEAECRILRFKSCFATVGKLGLALDDPDTTLAGFAEEAEEFEGRLIDELHEMSCFALEGWVEELYQGRNHFGEQVSNQFPKAVVDIEEAAKCLALDRGTACVFHLMRVLEVGLREMATDLGITKVERNWQRLLDDVRSAIKKLPLTTQAEKDYQSHRSEAVAHLQAVKDAWRNDVIHPRDHYDPQQASVVWTHTRSLMKQLASFL